MLLQLPLRSPPDGGVRFQPRVLQPRVHTPRSAVPAAGVETASDAGQVTGMQILQHIG